MDKLSEHQRSHCMSQIKAKNTKPELLFRKYIWSKKIRGYRVNTKIHGKPDLFFPKKNIAIFIDGCFWHKCPTCFRAPKSNKKYWRGKIKRNVERDLETDVILSEKGINIIRFWEHEIVNEINQCYAELKRKLQD